MSRVLVTRWSPWVICGILAAMLVGTIDALVCSQLASPKRRYVFLPRDWF